jgi:hypothetical protein
VDVHVEEAGVLQDLPDEPTRGVDAAWSVR